MADLTPDDMAAKLLASGFQRQSPAAQALSDPIADTPMVVTLDELRPYELDPRLTRNPLYDEIKASIHERGLDAPPPITRRPGAGHYIIRNGGNTRLAILRELWSETKDERFFRISCLFRPWPERGEIVALTGHLAENELHGGLTFIERALGVEKARELYEHESGKPPSQSELARRLAADGYPVQQSHISRMQDTVRYLLPAIPNVLYGGLGRHQIERLAVLRKAAEFAWETRAHGKPLSVDFGTLFHEVLTQFDTPTEAFSPQRVQDELIGQMAELLGADYNALELDIDNIENRQRAVNSPPSLPAEPPVSSPVDISPEPATTAPRVAPPSPSTTAGASEKISRSRDTPSPVSTTGTTHSQASVPEDDASERLQGHIVSPAASTERLQAIQQLVAEHTGEATPDFTDNVLRAIPVQAGGLFPITDVWYIEPSLDAPDRLRIHIAQFAREIAEEAKLADCVESIESGIGFTCSASLPATSVVPPFGRAVLALLQMLTLDHPSSQAAPCLDELGVLLQGDRPGRPVTIPRLSDTGLVKLFRLLRLARRLVELEAGPDDASEG
ncbi:TPA: ParB N-terminal domain-containing protein [Burkholderia vietnamiensis]|uniref:ParB family protein n=1 Tax=Burkholderiaceae TaxID=119060 RepID=UPI00158E4A5E|nr:MULTISPECIES: ParB family protein [Burkholderiaceae]MBR8165966.1 ParB N-terminal domain-containing protein [Burkholderia vietnamiensis]MCA7943062.1 ParB N-terminal domain-containing protein [Burkholderia vietnamiensis]MCA8148783.1 ParB N-terminal domain-containing protein [Burkholderia vietnamiensis]MCA8193914.1 ParB N-terminal domain-containing protein [Burkholderia vietnamiensis]MCO8318064.1 ParB N-terminal domain-containing protein [Burkholderia multivorans]